MGSHSLHKVREPATGTRRQWLGPRVDLWSEVWDRPIAFIIIAVVVGLIVQVIGFSLLVRLPEDTRERRANQLFGIIPGFINGLIIAAILSALLL
ncbi:MAG TPA: CvpA family protein, partial [Terriglobales bacterium]|nr:CvpA family protein [Terriglobales bacterium]